MKWKLLIALLIMVLMTAGCAEKSQESGSSASAQASGAEDTQETGSSEAGVPIDSVVFSRTGALV